jgi:hypothetical protein
MSTLSSTPDVTTTPVCNIECNMSLTNNCNYKDILPTMCGIQIPLHLLRIAYYPVCSPVLNSDGFLSQKFGGNKAILKDTVWPLCKSCGLPMSFVCRFYHPLNGDVCYQLFMCLQVDNDYECASGDDGDGPYCSLITSEKDNYGSIDRTGLDEILEIGNQESDSGLSPGTIDMIIAVCDKIKQQQRDFEVTMPTQYTQKPPPVHKHTNPNKTPNVLKPITLPLYSIDCWSVHQELDTYEKIHAHLLQHKDKLEEWILKTYHNDPRLKEEMKDFKSGKRDLDSILGTEWFSDLYNDHPNHPSDKIKLGGTPWSNQGIETYDNFLQLSQDAPFFSYMWSDCGILHLSTDGTITGDNC